MSKAEKERISLIEKIKAHPKPWAIGAASVAVVGALAGIIIGAGALGNNFNPDSYLNNKANQNKVSYDSTVYHSNSHNSSDSKEMDKKADEDYSLGDKKDTISIVDSNNNSDGSGNGENGGNGGYVNGGGKPIVVVNPGGGSGDNGGGNAGTGGTGGNGGEPTTDPQDPTDPTEPSEWKVTNFTVEPTSATNRVQFFKYMTVTEQKIKERIIVTASYQSKLDSNKTKTEVINDYSISSVSDNYLGKQIADSDVGKTFDAVISVDGMKKTVNCNIFDDYITYERVSVSNKSSINFAVGDVPNLNKKQEIVNNIDVTGYGYTYSGLQKITVYHLQNDQYFAIDFHDANGNEGDNVAITKSVNTANITVRDQLKRNIKFKNVLKYNVFNYRLAVMYTDGSVLRTIYQDSPVFDLTKPSNNAVSTYNDMISRLKADGLYKTDANGFLKTTFYGWSLYKDNENYNDALTKYTFSGSSHSATLYPLPLKTYSDDFYIKTEGIEQILKGYGGTGSVLEVPYGVTQIKIDSDFITTDSAQSIKEIVIPSTVTSIDFSAVSGKFPNLAAYKVTNSTGFSSDDSGILYSADGKTLVRVPVKSANEINIGENVEEIVSGAFDDAVSYLSKNKQTLTLNMLGDNPPELYLSNAKFSGLKNYFKIKVKDSDEITNDYLLKRYTATYGAMLDTAFGEKGYALKSIIYTDSGAQSKYSNSASNVYSPHGSSLKLEAAAINTEEIYNIEKGVSAIADHAFYCAESITIINLSESVKTLDSNAFAVSDNSKLCAVKVTPSQKINISADVIGDYKSLKSNFHIFVSPEQNNASAWLSSLKDSYGAENATRILSVNGGELEYINGCIYYKNEDKLTLYYAPSEIEDYTAPENLTEIADYAFSGCAFHSITLPSVEKINYDSFYNCDNLEVISIQNENLICNTTFSTCKNLRYILLNDNNFNALTSAEKLSGKEYSFENNIVFKNEENSSSVLYGIKSLSGYAVLKDDTTAILPSAFENCTLLEGFSSGMLEKIESIGENAFEGCENFGADGAEIVLTAKTIGDNAFKDCTSIHILSLDTGIKTIGERAFSDCSELRYIYWKAETTEVGDYLFAGCNKLLLLSLGDENLDLNNKAIPTIGSYTFTGNTSLSNINFHTPVEHIGDYTFSKCTNAATAADIYANNTSSVDAIKSIGDYAFEGLYVVNVTPQDSQIETLGKGVFKDCTSMSSFTIPENLKEIPDYCYAGCSSLRNIYNRHSQFSKIGKGAFSGCVALQRFNDTSFNNSLTLIDDYAFSDYTINGTDYSACSALVTFITPSNLKEIGDHAFSGNTALESLDLSRSRNLESIGVGAFENCTALECFDAFYTSFTALNEDTFMNCSNLTSAILPYTLSTIKAGALANCPNLNTLYLRHGDVVNLNDDALTTTGSNENLLVYVPKSENSVVKNKYIADSDWSAQVDNRQSDIIREIDINNIIIDGGIYETDEDGTYTLLSVLPTTSGSFNIYSYTTAIEPDAFKDCSALTMVSVPTGIDSLPNGIFKDCPLLEAVVINEIGYSSEDGVHPMVKNDGDFFEGGTANPNFRIYVSGDALPQYNGWYDAPVYSFGENFAFESNVLYGIVYNTLSRDTTLLYIPRSYSGALNVYNDTHYIAESAGENCTSLTDVTLNLFCHTICKRAFKGCTSLKSFYAANTSSTMLQNIEDEAFMNCTSLIGSSKGYANRLTLPISVISIGNRVFMNCTSLVYMSIQGETKEIGDECYSGCTSLSTFTGSPAGLASIQRIGKRAFYNCPKIVSLSWTNMASLKEVDDSAYENCSNIILATFADKLQRIGNNAFKGTHLQSITFNGTVPPTLGENIIDESLQKNMAIYVPKCNTGSEVPNAYKSAWKTTYPLLANAVQGIDGYSFRMVSNVLYLINPASAKELTAIKVVPSLSAVTFYNASSLYCIGIADDTLSGCNLIKTITLTANIKSIGARAFKDCSALATVNTNSALTSIGEQAFSACRSLKTISIPATVTSIGSRAFENTDSLTQLVIRSDIPITLSDKLFGDSVPENVKIYVPSASLELYRDKWGAVLDKNYGEGTANRLIVGY